jgi:aminoglycoside 3-N-acetyltransferase
LNPVDEMLAAGEVAGRLVAERIPKLRGWFRQKVRENPRREPVTLDQLGACIRSLGFTPGRDLLVHSSLVGLRQLQAKLPEQIEFLVGLAGSEATLLMPTHPATRDKDGLAVYDVARSPSTVGMLTERFRKLPGALRSPFPVAPVAAFGPRAALYTRDFRRESGGTPYGQGSPYQTLTREGGQVLYLGIDFIRALTLEHVAFDLLAGDHPVPDYYVEKSFLVLHEGREERVDVRHQSKDLEWRIASIAMRRMVLRSGSTRATRLAGIPVAVMDARRFLEWHLPLARSRGWPYWCPLGRD